MAQCKAGSNRNCRWCFPGCSKYFRKFLAVSNFWKICNRTHYSAKPYTVKHYFIHLFYLFILQYSWVEDSLYFNFMEFSVDFINQFVSRFSQFDAQSSHVFDTTLCASFAAATYSAPCQGLADQ